MDLGARKIVTIPSLRPDYSGFIGRTAELEKLTEFFKPSSSSSTTARVALIVGAAAVGKTALASMAIHRLEPYFPDGVIFTSAMHATIPSSGSVDLPLDIYMEVLASAQGQLPDLRLLDDDELRNLYLQKLSESRMLVIIDEAHELSHIEELIPLNARSGLILISQQHPVRIQPGLIM